MNINDIKDSLSEENFIMTSANKSYEMNLRCCNECISIIVKTQLPFSIYEGHYFFEELSKKPLFNNYDDITSIYDKLVSKIRNKSLTLKLDNNVMTVSTVFLLDEEFKTVDLTLKKQEKVEEKVVVEEVSKAVILLENKVNKLSEERKEITVLKEELSNLLSYCYQNKIDLAKSNKEIKELKENLDKSNQEILSIKDHIKNNFIEMKEEIFRFNQNNLFESSNLYYINQKTLEAEIIKVRNTLEKETTDIKQELVLRTNLTSSLNQRLILLEDGKKIKIQKEKKEKKKIQKEKDEKNNEEENKEFYKNLTINPKCLIRNINELNKLKEWIITSSHSKNTCIKFVLLYNSLVDSDSANEFHKKCDNKGATISIIESENGLRFGGYTALNWESDNNGKYKGNDSTAFIFSLTNMKMFKCKDQSRVILCHKDYNVIYGGNNCDIAIQNNFTLVNKNYSYFGTSYDASGIDEPMKYLAGSNEFKVKHVEVYKVRFLKKDI